MCCICWAARTSRSRTAQLPRTSSRSSSSTCRSARHRNGRRQYRLRKPETVATFTIAGHPRKLWVAPTRAGGYCYTFELSFGGCRQTRADRAKAPLGVTWQGGSLRHGVNESIITRVGGDITAPAAAKITARYADGTTADIPFVWVSAPIAAGFFTNDIPTAHWNKQHRLLALTLYSKNGTRLGRQAFQYTAKPGAGQDPDPAITRWDTEAARLADDAGRHTVSASAARVRRRVQGRRRP